MRCALSVFGVIMPKRASTAATFAVDLPSLRREVTELVAKNAVPMVRQAIDSVTEEGQYQAIKYLFQMIGLYPAASPDESPLQESLARTLLERLGLPEIAMQEPVERAEKIITDRDPLE